MEWLFYFCLFFFFTCPSCLRFSCCAARCFLFVHKGEMQSVTNQLTFTQAIICLWFLYLNTAQTFGQAIRNQVSIKLKHGQNWECVLFASMMTLFYAIWITIPSSKRVQIWTFRCQHLWFVSCKQSRGIQNCRTYTVKYKLTVFLSIVENIYLWYGHNEMAKKGMDSASVPLCCPRGGIPNSVYLIYCQPVCCGWNPLH